MLRFPPAIHKMSSGTHGGRGEICAHTFMVSRGLVTTEFTTPAEMPAQKCRGIP